MKYVLLLIVMASALLACRQSNSSPKLNYECRDYFSKDDWELTYNERGDTIKSCRIDKKIFLKSDIFMGAKDSVTVEMLLSKSEYDKLPVQDSLRSMIFDALLSCKYACKNIATFNPYKIWMGFSTNDKTKNEEFFIYVDFLASNSYGTPGELNGSFRYDAKTFKMTSELVYE